tara:strand:+ start:764 stop:1030 length:267 start_codon:yes stop_codon:yes gene_type:complete
MPTTINKNVNLILLITRHDNGFLTHVAGEKISRLFDLRNVAKKQPALLKDLFLFEPKNLLVYERFAADCGKVVGNKLFNVHRPPPSFS